MTYNVDTVWRNNVCIIQFIVRVYEQYHSCISEVLFFSVTACICINVFEDNKVLS